MRNNIAGVKAPEHAGQGSGQSVLRCKLSRFVRDEDGALLIFGVYVFLMILMVAGIGIDFMHFERDRTNLQNTLDRSVLAAADLDQTLEPEAVVADYFNKAGLAQYLSSVTVTQELGFRSVAATAEAEYRTQFMHMSGVDTLTAPAASTAEESIGAVEISLVLDISGSMNSSNRLPRLKVAAKSFVEQIFAGTDSSRASISIIPYATQVNAGETLLDEFYNVSDEHHYSHCINFLPSQFNTATLHRNENFERTAHFDPFTRTEDPISMPVCPTRTGSAILPVSNNKTNLLNSIDILTARGNTSIDLGVKWGAALLDPSMRPVISDLAAPAVGYVDANMSNRPLEYGSADALKIIVVMSDGQNTNQYFLNPSLRTGLSDVWYNAEADRYSVYKSEGNPNYWWPHSESWTDHPYGNGTSEVCTGWGWSETCSEQEEPGTAVRLTFQELFNRTSLKWNAQYNYGFTSSRYAQWYQAAFSYKNRTAKDQYAKQICDAAKDEGVIVFAIGFEAPRNGQRVLKDCASSASHYFDAEGEEINDAFTSIASSIRKLRLTQ